ncbi:MAG: Asp/Glu racemase [Clostridiales bacterium]|nr:Asp/Glu racemase [Clostridiales bacterium]
MAYKTFIDGWRGRIGLITPSPGSSTEQEFNRYAPEGVAVLTTRIPLFGISYEGINKMRSYINDAALMLAESSEVDVIIFSCTAGSFMDGSEYDKKIIDQLEALTKKPVTTTSTCVLEAMRELNIKSVNIVTPYSDEINKLECAFFEGCGIKVTGISGSLLKVAQDVPKIPAGDMYRYAIASDSPEADATFVSCTGLHVLGILEKLENDLKKPAFSSNQCGLWGSLRKLNVHDKIPGLGILFNR